MRMIIVGASGMIGSSLFTAAKDLGITTMGTGKDHAGHGLIRYDMCTERLGSVLEGLGPQDTVYLLSAYKDMAWVYANQQKAAVLNLQASKRLIDEVADRGARIIFMSSVEVFSSEEGNYNETSKPNPQTAYGKMKYEIEEYLFKKKCKSCIVRTGWNVGWDLKSPCVVKLTYQALMEPGAKMASDNIFSIIDVRDTAQGLLKLLNRPEVAVCHLASSPPIIRSELASMIMDYSKYKKQMSFDTVLFKDIHYPQKRSRYNQLDNSFAVKSLGINFRTTQEIIRQKVELLDEGIGNN